MTTKSLSNTGDYTPAFTNQFLNPWRNWMTPFDGWEDAVSLPAVNIAEQKEKFELTLAVPGLAKSDFKISLEGDVLSISSEKKEESEETKGKFTRKEFSYSSFNRSFTLPNTVQSEKIEAKYENGILKIVIPKKAEAQNIKLSKEIAVK